MRLEQRRLCRVALEPPASPERLAQFLSRPIRPLRGLLHADRLQPSGPGLYTYISRPYSVAGWTLQPHVRLEARWQHEALVLRQLESRVEGLGAWQQKLQFGLEARLKPVAAGGGPAGAAAGGACLQAEALVWAELPAAAAVVAGPVLNLGLQQLLDRLERRCHHGLRRRAECWLRRATSLELDQTLGNISEVE
ncbi:DUF1997 domain-containing protein [Cyanobium sp. ATX 6A2]|uniref:DUF1997 domain-containing protein n=1 Tax=Cyanobium sp. ATX 6A2 TaxID=2823700 RepID=UPI0020CBBFAB|nr:DUF1997 domain-containing protein [Cyanobium sp. ATX 6A2]MCP9889248.1 DUF1997 domain-containing protein [Cyanobium sp. ATX 6A2]